MTANKIDNNYAFEHDGKAFTLDGSINVPNIETHNQALELKQIEALKQGIDTVVLYMKHDPWKLTTWPGTVVAEYASVGSRINTYFGGNHSYRRHVTARIFGTLYHGWYMESSGDYVRLKKAKR